MQGLNPKREALAQAARVLRRSKASVIGLYLDHKDIIQDIDNEYHGIIHGIEMEIVDLDKQLQEAKMPEKGE